MSQCVGVHGRKLGERADLAQRHASVDAVTDRKTGHVRADLLDDAGKLVTHDEGESVGGEQLDLAAHHHVVQRVDRRGVDLDEHFVRGGGGGGDLAYFEVGRVLVVAGENSCLHDGPSVRGESVWVRDMSASKRCSRPGWSVRVRVRRLRSACETRWRASGGCVPRRCTRRSGSRECRKAGSDPCR